MINRSSMAKRVLQVTAALALALPATLASAPGEAHASACSVWALADRYDHEPKAYAAGGLNSCPIGVITVDIVLYKDGLPVATTSIKVECRDHNQPCAGWAGPVDAPPGHSFCAKTFVYTGAFWPAVVHQGNCFVS